MTRCRHYEYDRVEGGLKCGIGLPIRKIMEGATKLKHPPAIYYPCFSGDKKYADCPSYDPKTQEEVESDRKAAREHMDQAFKMITKASEWKAKMIKLDKVRATASCPCCGSVNTVTVLRARSNNHLRAQCSKCDVGFME